MIKNNRFITILSTVIFALLLIITIYGVCSFQAEHSYYATNQYGESIRIWGAGIYAHDSYFKAPIFIGTDFTILLLAVPLMIIAFFKLKSKPTSENCIQYFSISSLLLYYSASISFGVTYNNLHLAYMALFSGTFFLSMFLFMRLYGMYCKQADLCTFTVPKGLKAFLVIAGMSLFVAWLPDIITSLITGTSLDLIEVYTTEITYILDMGIISPLMFLTLYLINKHDFVGYILLRMLLKICAIIGIMLPLQTAAQMLADISVPVPALITKVMIFVLLAVFAVFFDQKLKHSTRWNTEEI